MERKNELILGGGLIAFGIVILLFVFVNAYNLIGTSGTFLKQQVPEIGNKPPRCSFSWNSDGLGVTFNDQSQEGSSPITVYHWEFDDGQTSSQKNPHHVFSGPGSYHVRLSIQDAQGQGDSCYSNVSVEPGSQRSGSSESSAGMKIEFDMSSSIMLIAVVILTIGLYAIMVMVGSSILRAGWNIIRPRPDVVQVRVRPKDIVVEPPEIRNIPPTQPPPPQPPPPQPVKPEAQPAPSQTSPKK